MCLVSSYSKPNFPGGGAILFLMNVAYVRYIAAKKSP